MPPPPEPPRDRASEPAFALHMPESVDCPVLIAAPHGGRRYPSEVIAAMRAPDLSCLRLEDRLVDRLAGAVAAATGAALLVAHAPRAVIDLNRSPDDIDWSMIAGPNPVSRPSGAANRRARSGLGLVPRRLPDLGEIWNRKLDRAELDARIADVHRPYHVALGQALERIRDRWGAVLLLDLHSMPPLKQGGVQGLSRKDLLGQGTAAEFVVGDRFGASCGDGLAAQALEFLAANERRVAHNRPYSGGYVLDRHAAPRRGIHALQLEVCRSAYLDADMREPGPRMPGMIRLLGQLVRTLAGQVAQLGAEGSFRHAAE